MRKAFVFGVLFLAAILCASQSSASLIGFTADIEVISAPPSVELGAIESSAKIRAFAEKQNLALPSSVTANITAPGTYTFTSGGPPVFTSGTLATGTVVSSYLLHFDPAGSPGTPIARTGSVTFDEEVLGVIVLASSLIASDATLGAPGTFYSANGLRGLETGPPGDSVTLSPDRRTVLVTLNIAPTFDEVRIITGGMAVAVDIKPQSCPNPVNTRSRGVLPVAILGTASLNVADINVATIRLAGVAPLRSAVEDVATPFNPFTGRRNCNADCNVLGADGYRDLTLKFDTQAIAAALGSVTDGQCRVVRLTGNLRNGTAFHGEDVIVTLDKE